MDLRVERYVLIPVLKLTIQNEVFNPIHPEGDSIRDKTREVVWLRKYSEWIVVGIFRS